MTQGRKEEAQKELLRVARVNGREIPENLLREVSSIRHSRLLTIINLILKAIIMLSFV